MDKIDDKTGKTKGEMILEYCTEPRTRKELLEYFGVCDETLRMQMKPLLESGKLQRTIPNNIFSGKQKFFTILI